MRYVLHIGPPVPQPTHPNVSLLCVPMPSPRTPSEKVREVVHKAILSIAILTRTRNIEVHMPFVVSGGKSAMAVQRGVPPCVTFFFRNKLVKSTPGCRVKGCSFCSLPLNLRHTLL